MATRARGSVDVQMMEAENRPCLEDMLLTPMRLVFRLEMHAVVEFVHQATLWDTLAEEHTAVADAIHVPLIAIAREVLSLPAGSQAAQDKVAMMKNPNTALVRWSKAKDASIVANEYFNLAQEACRALKTKLRSDTMIRESRAEDPRLQRLCDLARNSPGRYIQLGNMRVIDPIVNRARAHASNA